MVGDVSKELTERERLGESWDTELALGILERHPDYGSFISTHQRRIQAQASRLQEPELMASPEHTVIFGSALPARMHLTIKQIAQIEVWWKLQK
jgi:hypothetical protein